MMPPRPWRFPQLQRLISAFSNAVMVVQAAERSGGWHGKDRRRCPRKDRVGSARIRGLTGGAGSIACFETGVDGGGTRRSRGRLGFAPAVTEADAKQDQRTPAPDKKRVEFLCKALVRVLQRGMNSGLKVESSRLAGRIGIDHSANGGESCLMWNSLVTLGVSGHFRIASAKSLHGAVCVGWI